VSAELDLFSIGSWTVFDHIYELTEPPRPGRTIVIRPPRNESVGPLFGDCSANVATAARRMGLSVGLATVVGEDFRSSGYWGWLDSLGIDLRGVEVRAGSLSGRSYLFTDPQGDDYCLSELGVAQEQKAWTTPLQRIYSSRAVVINEMFSPYTLQAARAAHDSGALCVINGMIATASELATSFLRSSDVLVISRAELDDLLAALHLSAATGVHPLGPRRIFVTRGSEGSSLFVDGQRTDVACVPPKQTVDTTGAGDAFAAGVTAALLRGFPDEVAARVGATAASFVVEAVGAQTTQPSWSDIEIRFSQYFKEELE
jgi:sugar/nucleoside kinase (ribokinase family)